MNYIKIELNGERININMEGEPKDLVGMVASSIINDEQFALIILSALATVADHGNPINNINPN